MANQIPMTISAMTSTQTPATQLLMIQVPPTMISLITKTQRMTYLAGPVHSVSIEAPGIDALALVRTMSRGSWSLPPSSMAAGSLPPTSGSGCTGDLRSHRGSTTGWWHSRTCWRAAYGHSLEVRGLSGTRLSSEPNHTVPGCHRDVTGRALPSAHTSPRSTSITAPPGGTVLDILGHGALV